MEEEKIPPHEVQQYYRDYVQGGPVPTDQQFAEFPPYGHIDDPHTMVRHGIQGPANHDQLWTTWDSAGTDYLAPIPQGQPLSDQQMDQVQGLTQMWTDIVWEERIGQGGFGTIWRVSANRMGTNELTGAEEIVPVLVAVKVLRIAQNFAFQFYEKVEAALRDVHVVRGLSHLNVLTVDDYIAIPDQTTHFPFSAVLIFMGLCAGNLTELMQSHRFGIDAEHCVLWFAPIVFALGYLHLQRVVHLDIKPQNILFTIDGPFDLHEVSLDHNLLRICTFKLADFGFGIKYGKDIPMVFNNRRGTMAFMAPELSMAGPSSTELCDVYSLGRSLAYVLVGHRPYFMNQHNLVPYIVAQNVPQVFIDLVMGMTAAVPQRLQLHEIVNHEYIARVFDPNSPFFDEVLMNAIINANQF